MSANRELFDAQTDEDHDPFRSIGSQRFRKSKPVEVCEHSEYALMSEVPSPVPSDWPQHPTKNYPLPPAQIKMQERTRFALGLCEKAQKEKEGRVSQGKAANYTTAHALNWGRKLGWKVLDKERWDHRNKRHRDLTLAADVMFETPRGIVFVQAAGAGERASHRLKFDMRGGLERCVRLRVGFLYVTFCRESIDPVSREWWASLE